MKLGEIKKLCNEATPGPWKIFLAYEEDERAYLDGPQEYTENRFHINDAKFIAAARELIPKLLNVAKAAKIVNDAMIREKQYIYGAEILDEALEELEKE
jgi:hypothetical protein